MKAFLLNNVESVVVIVLYVITFIIIDRKNISKEKTKKKLSFEIMIQNYDSCIQWINQLDKELVDKYVISKIDFNQSNDPIINSIKTAPFQHEDILFDLFRDGQTEIEILKEYYKTKEQYERYITMRIILFDNPSAYLTMQSETMEQLEKAKKNLEKKRGNLK